MNWQRSKGWSSMANHLLIFAVNFSRGPISTVHSDTTYTYLTSNYSFLCEHDNTVIGTANDGQVNLSAPVNLLAGMPIFGKDNFHVKASDYYPEDMQRNSGNYGPRGISPLPATVFPCSQFRSTLTSTNRMSRATTITTNILVIVTAFASWLKRVHREACWWGKQNSRDMWHRYSLTNLTFY
jgi:hypothetical protein